MGKALEKYKEIKGPVGIEVGPIGVEISILVLADAMYEFCHVLERINEDEAKRQAG